MTQMREDSGFWSLPPLTTLCWRNTFGHHKAFRGWTWTTPQPDWLHSSEEALLIRSEHCQNTKFPRSRHWKWPRLADDDFPPSSEKNQQAKTHKIQVWPRKAKRPQWVGNLPSYDWQEVCTSHHHKQWRHRPGFNDHYLQYTSDWNSQWDPWQTSSEEKILDHSRNSWSVRQKVRTEKEQIWARRSWEIQGSEEQHQEVHKKEKKKTG